MKKGILILLGMFMMVSTVEAKNGEDLSNRFRVDYYNYNNAVNFIENGIEFYIFTNGDFDFDIRFNNRYNRIIRDFNGQIRRIGNVVIRYDRRGNVTRIGNVFVRYHRNRLARVGDLRVNYDRWGYPVFYGNVRDFYYDNGIRFNVNFGDVFVYNDPYFFRNDFRNNYIQFREDRNFFYYKARPNARLGNRSTIIKRRKAANTVRNNQNTRRNENNSYRRSRTNATTSRNSSTKRDETRSTSRTSNSRNSSVKRESSRDVKFKENSTRVKRTNKNDNSKNRNSKRGKRS